ncbi:stage II sporulation protein M [Paenibacillus pinihumi]|uniref:stage II sporulation protein M n=1 Tax=Paenibacillus pinihumi TaxID=669462 RepID=UPI0003F749D7|nr:stage II sporulation protein M [Paenibacillus pinihumi]
MKSPFLQPLVKDQLSLYIFVGVLFIVGVVFGVVMAGALTLEQQQDLTGDVEHFVKLLDAGLGPDKAASFWDRAWFHTKWMLLIWLLGLTVIGMPMLLVLDFLKGVLVGFSMGLLIGQHAWIGAFFWFISVAPQNILIVPALLIASVGGISFAVHFIKVRLLQNSGSLTHSFAAHTLTAIGMLAVLWVAAWFEAYVSPLIMGWASRFL